MIGSQLGILFRKAFDQDFATVGHTITIRVEQVDHFAGQSDNDARLPQHQSGGEVESICKHSARLIKTIAIQILKAFDRPLLRGLWIFRNWIVRHFDHPQHTLMVKFHGHRISDQRLTCHQLHLHTFRKMHLLYRFPCRKRPWGIGRFLSQLRGCRGQNLEPNRHRAKQKQDPRKRGTDASDHECLTSSGFRKMKAAILPRWPRKNRHSSDACVGG